jgi:hypothetical protein
LGAQLAQVDAEVAEDRSSSRYPEEDSQAPCLRTTLTHANLGLAAKGEREICRVDLAVIIQIGCRCV